MGRVLIWIKAVQNDTDGYGIPEIIFLKKKSSDNKDLLKSFQHAIS